MRELRQTKYQVRFGWGPSAADRIARDAHLVVWVDVLPTDDRTPADDGAAADDRTAAGPLAAARLLPDGPEVVLGHLGNAAAVAERVTRLQAERGDRCVVAVVAASDDGAVEDLLAAGGVIDALVAAGIDHTSPEAAAACAAYTGLRRAVRHLVTASERAGTLPAERVRDAIAAGPDLVVLRDRREQPGREQPEPA